MLDLYGRVFAAPPFEVELKPEIHVDGIAVATGGGIGSAEDAQVFVTLTPPGTAPRVTEFAILAGEPAALSI